MRQPAVDYRTFVESWMAALPRKQYEGQAPGLPSDVRVMVLDPGTTVDQRLRNLSSDFNRWCRSAGATPLVRSDDMVTPGNDLLVCHGATGNTLGAFQGQTDPDAARQGRRELLLKHWYGGAILAYQAEFRLATERKAAEREERRRQQAAASAAAEVERQRSRAIAAQLPVTPGCRNFERQSNALRARFDAPVDRDSFARYLSDMVVALDECVHARPAPAERLATVYRYNLASFQVFGRAWQDGMLPCGDRGECQASAPMHEGQIKHVVRLQAEYTAIDSPVPAKPIGLIDRVVRFVVDR